MKISTLMKEYIDRSDSVSHNYAQRLIPESLKSFQNVPIVPSSQNEWTLHDHPERLVRLYTFGSHYHRNMFIDEILTREEETGHEAKITVEGMSVTVEVWTHDVERVTELDQEYAGFCDTLYNDVSLIGERYR
jgi:pterin-4a-carbinolamine dehydratase